MDTSITNSNEIIDTIDNGETEEVKNLTGMDRMKFILSKANIEYSEEDLKNTFDEYTKHTKIQLIRDKKEIENAIDIIPLLEEMVENYKLIEKNAETSSRPFELVDQISNTIDEKSLDPSQNLTNVNHPVEDMMTSWKKSLEKSKTEEGEDIKSVEDVKKMIKDMRRDVIVQTVALREAIGYYNESHGKTNIYQDIIEQLKRDKDTLSKSSDLNANFKISMIDRAITSIETYDYNQISMMIPKVQNIKNLRNLAKECAKPDKRKLADKVGFVRNYLDEFVSFFLQETRFRSIYSLDEWKVADQVIPEAAIPSVCELFMYHIAKVVEAERKHQNYKAILFKLIFFNILNVQESVKVDKNGMNRIVNDDTAEESKESKIRSNFYDAYTPILTKYYEALYMK